MNEYSFESLELHLFFSRIMKEHALFLEAGFQMKDTSHIAKARWYRVQFEALLREVVGISDGLIRGEILQSGEIVTGYTPFAEQKTQQLTGIMIDSRITAMEQHFKADCNRCAPQGLEGRVQRINQKAACLLDGLIAFKESILHDVKHCCLFTANYPLLIEHIIREAKLYRSFVRELEKEGCLCPQNMRDVELFWNQIMLEHALFILGLLDPTEAQLIKTADEFANDYACLLEEASRKNCITIRELTQRTVEETMRYRDFKAAGTKGIVECNIASLILPLLADHVLREANHYLRLLQE